MKSKVTIKTQKREIPPAQKESFAVYLKPYMETQLARLYNVSPATLRRRIKPFKKQIGERNGYYYMIRQVKKIIQKLGLPVYPSLSEIPNREK